jgi:hypothetical protein
MAAQLSESAPCTRCDQHRDSGIHLKAYGYANYHPYVGGEIVFAVDIGGLVVKLEQHVHCEQCQAPAFTVKYGQEAIRDLNYDQAADKLGASVMHALACLGLVDNS